MFVIKMNSDKSLSLTKTGTNYLNENKAEQILILLPKVYNNHNLQSYSIRMDWINQDLVGDAVEIEFSEGLRTGYIEANVDILNEWTYKVGNVEVWFIITYAPDIVIKTGSTFIPIKDHKVVTDFIPQQQLDLLDQFTIDMTGIKTEAEQAASVSSEQAGIATSQATLAQDYAISANQAKSISIEQAAIAASKANEANTSAENILASESKAKTSEDNAKLSETNVKASEQNAKTSETNSNQAKIASESARDASVLAKNAAEAAQLSSVTAKNLSVEAKTLSESAKNAALQSEQNALKSEQNAKVSETNSKTSETNAQTSATNALTAKIASETARDKSVAAKVLSESAKTASQTSETNAKKSEDNAKLSEIAANTAKGIAETKATEAAGSATAAKESETIVLQGEAARNVAYGQAEADRNTAYGVAENERNDLYGQAEVARDNLFNTAETSRAEAETQRITDESIRKTSENGRIASEVLREQTLVDMQNTLDNIVNANAEVEVVLARTGTDGVTHESLKARLDSDKAETELKSAQTTADIRDMQGTIRNLNPNGSDRVNLVSSDRIISLPKNAANGGLNVIIGGNTLKNELNYNRDTWAEWTKTTGIMGDATGLEFTYTDASLIVYYPKVFKNSTKYGILFNVVSSTITTGIFGIGGNGAGMTFPNTPKAIALGNNKAVLTSIASPSIHRFVFYVSGALNGEKLKLKDVQIFELPTGSQIETDFNTLTADQLTAKYPYISGDKERSVIAPRLRSVGKNLFNGKLELGSYSIQGVKVAATDRVRAEGLTKVKPNTSYIISRSGVKNLNSVLFYDGDKKLISIVGANPFTTPTNCVYCTFYFTSTSTINDVKLEMGTGATPYEPYTESLLYSEPIELRRLPNGVKDTIENTDYYQRIEEYTLQASDITAYTTTPTNIDYVIIKYNSDYVGSPSTPTGGLYVPIITKGYKAYADSVDNIGYVFTSTSTQFGIAFAKGTYANLTAAQTALAGTKIYYQLAIPTITENVQSGNLLSYPSGTVYLEPALADAGIYKDKISILRTDFPISTLETVKKIDYLTGKETPLDASKAVVAVGKLSFTHPDLVADDIVFFTYFYAENSPYGENTLSYLDSNNVIKDSVTGKFYKVVKTVANGVKTETLVEV